MNTFNAAITRRAFLGGAAAFGVSMALPVGAFAAPTSADVQAQADEARERLNNMVVELGKYSYAYNQALEDHDAAMANMGEAQAKIDVNTARISELQERLGMRARDMYRNGSTTFLDILLGSSTFDEFIRNWDALQAMNEHDADMVAQTKALRVDNEIQRGTYEHEAQIATEKMAEADEARGRAEMLVEEYQAEVDSLDAEVAALIVKEEEEARAAAEAEALRVAMEAEAARRAAEEEARAAAEQEQQEAADEPEPENEPEPATESDPEPEPEDEPEPEPEDEPEPEPEDEDEPVYEPEPEYEDEPEYEPEPVNSGGGSSSYGYAVLGYAQGQLGVPYVWGGDEPGVGLDCSGLTSYCWMAASGIWIGRTTGAQYASAHWVGSPSQAQVGDVLYYDGHVSICASDGAGSYIHAPKPGDVVSYCSASWWNPWTAALRWY